MKVRLFSDARDELRVVVFDFPDDDAGAAAAMKVGVAVKDWLAGDQQVLMLAGDIDCGWL